MKGSNVALVSLSEARRIERAAADVPAKPDDSPLSAREVEILAAMEPGCPMTDREVAVALEQQDMNYVRPHITRLLSRGILRQHVDRRCLVTGVRVRTTYQGSL